MSITTREYYIAYFDVLGYKAFFTEQDNDIYEFLKSNIDMANDIIRKTELGAVFDNIPFEVKSFSDNFMILIPKTSQFNDYQTIKVLSYLMALFQLRFLEKYSILVRGSITIGDAYLNNHIVFGNGLIHAVELEGQANFPRIILDHEKIGVNICDDLCEKCVQKDEDGVYYINFFGILGSEIGFDGEFSYNEDKHLEMIRKNIIKLVNKHGKYNRSVKDAKKIAESEKTISKYAWLLTKFNQYCDFYWPEYKIPYTLTLYYRLMRCEISVEK